ncbi:MAG: RNA polymerase sigma factor [Clostridia bacterium]|nr:RNA polymerase sigma factor [Clostridia bacterium]
MVDEKIVELYWQRDERAIRETRMKYGRYCYSIAYNILHNTEDAQECENDTYLGAWNSMPPQRPSLLSSFLGAISRRVSLDRWRRKNAAKRGGGETAISLTELEECIPSGKSIEESVDTARLAELISLFLQTLPEDESMVFLRRYWYFDSIDMIRKRFGYGESKVKMILFRTRQKLLERLEKEGVFV